MRNPSLDATILLETPPEFEIREGLVYITDVIGGLVIRRVMRPHTFERSMRHCAKLLAEWRKTHADTVLRFAGPESGSGKLGGR